MEKTAGIQAAWMERRHLSAIRVMVIPGHSCSIRGVITAMHSGQHSIVYPGIA